jgi:DHA2 family multidrug resistance protein
MSTVAPPEKATTKQWIAVAGVVLGAFMAILDTSITNSSLQDIQGTLSASLTEGSWISTSYLVTEIIVIPLTAFFCMVFSMRRYLLANVIIFLVFSGLCGMARSLGAMIFFRAAQGFAGGALIPIAMTVIVSTLPGAQQAIGFALFGLATTFAPSLGPSLGGWLTSHFGWPFIFYINFLSGIPLLYLISKGLDPEPMKLDELKKADWSGVVSMGVFLGTLTTILEEGNREDWLGSSYIVKLTIICVISLLTFVYLELTKPNPIVDLRLLGKRNFLAVCLMSVCLGVCIYAPNYITPLFLSSISGFDALEIGKTMMWIGFPQLLIMPMVPYLSQRVDARILIGIGFFLMAVSLMMNADLTLNFGKSQFAVCFFVRALAVPFMITPMSAIAFHNLKPSEIGNASGLFNMLRNLGGSVGIGLIGAIASNRYALHYHRLSEGFSSTDSPTNQRLSQIIGQLTAQGSSLASATQKALQMMNGILNRESFILAYGDGFRIMGVVTFASLLCLLFMDYVKGASGPAH